MLWPYEILDYAARLSFRDAHGLDARYHVYQRLRVLEPDAITTITDFAWGDGDPLFSYSIAPNFPVTAVRRGRELLIQALPTTLLRHGQELEIHSIRGIHHGFKADKEWWEFRRFTPTRRASLAISFPIGREVSNLDVSSVIGTPAANTIRSGTKEVQLFFRDPAIGHPYRIDWSW